MHVSREVKDHLGSFLDKPGARFSVIKLEYRGAKSKFNPGKDANRLLTGRSV